MAVLIMMGVCAFPLLIMGLFLRRGRGLMLISGYSALPKAAKDRIDKIWLGRAAGNMLIRMSIELVLMGVAIYLEIGIFFVAIFALLMVDACFSSIRIYSVFPRTRKSVWGMRILIVTSVATIIGVGILFYFGEREPNITVGYNSVRIDGMYGVEIDFAAIREITLIESPMRDIGAGMRQNGFNLGTTLKGNFTRGRLFVDSDSSPTIRIELSPQNIYISFRDSGRTRSLYTELTGAIQFD
ncbi:MAG: DUF3784 domain-containing protein [Defluviitaleaceae bacterium]|nr:DUF3784 domain-containing protein [Defluviitaleaceae bacterium]